MHIYNSQFMEYTDRSSRHSARTIATILRDELNIGSVLDIGCATGTWLSEWQEAGINDVFGVDGSYVSPNTLIIPLERFAAADLSQSIDLQRKFDLVQSLEVAEHIPASAADQFVENLVKHSSGIVLFSAAPPGQGGEFHVNEQPYEYWREKFRAHGFEAYDCVRPRIADDKAVSFWYRFNVLLYVHKDVADRLSSATAATKVAELGRVRDLSPPWFRMRKFVVRMLPYAAQQYLAQLKARL